MECILSPDRLNINPNATDSEREFQHWKTTFENFIKKCQFETPKKLCCFVNYVSATIYKLILDCTTYKSAFNTLDKYFIKKKIQSLCTTNEFLPELSKNCQFVNITAKQY